MTITNGLKTFGALLVVMCLLTVIPVTTYAQPTSAPSGTCTNNQVTGAPALAYFSGVIFGCINNAWSPIYQGDNSFTGTGAMRVCHARYSFAADGGAISTITPITNCTIPIKAVIMNVAINSTTAGASGGSATIAVGTTAGSSSTALLAATAVASFTTNAFIHGVPTPQTASTWVKTTAVSQVTFTVATATLTAGIIEAYLFYYVSST